jgi:glucose/arabinose dehydrogenase
MRCLHWPELRPVWAVMAAAGCLILAACGGGSSSSAKPASPATTASASTAEPTSGPAAVAAITANWKTVFNGKAPIPRRLALVQDGSQVAAFVQAQAKTSFGQAATGSTATVSAVTITSPSQATVHYQVLLLGTPLLKNQVGTAIYQDGIWKVAIASFCGLAYLEYPKGSPKLPAACRS